MLNRKRMCVCVCERERERVRERSGSRGTIFPEFVMRLPIISFSQIPKKKKKKRAIERAGELFREKYCLLFSTL